MDKLIVDLQDSEPLVGSDRHDLLTALKHAGRRVGDDQWASPEHVRYAQAMLEIAVEWSMPAVERWATAWLMASGGKQLRIRWSSRSRSGKMRRDGFTADPITAIASARDRVVIGCDSGAVDIWSDEAGLSPLGCCKSPVSAIASCGDKILAAGSDADFFTVPATWVVPSLQRDDRLRPAVITAAAISKTAHVACGDEVGNVFIHPPDGLWIPLPSPAGRTRVMELSFCTESTIKAVWRNGWTAQSSSQPFGQWIWQRRLELPSEAFIATAAFNEAADWLAFADQHGKIYRVQPPDVRPAFCWGHPGAGGITWSLGGLLASAGWGIVLIGEPGIEPEPISGEAATDLVAFLGPDHVVTAGRTEVVQWAVREAGSDLPDLVGEDRVTAIAIDPQDPARTMAGTRRGHLLCCDGLGHLQFLYQGDKLGGRIHGLTRAGDAWLVAAQTGAYQWTEAADTEPLPLTRHLCRAVATWGEHSVYAANHEVRAMSGECLFTFADLVRDICYGPGGCVAAIDVRGAIQARDAAGRQWRTSTKAGSRLLAIGTRSVRIWHPDGTVLETLRYGEYRLAGRLPPDTRSVRVFDRNRIIAVCADRGFGLLDLSGTRREQPSRQGVATRAETADSNERRIVVAAGKRIAGYDLLDTSESKANGIISLAAQITAGMCTVTLPNGSAINIPPQRLADLRGSTMTVEFAKRYQEFRNDVDGLWEAARRLAASRHFTIMSAAGALGDMLWQAGLGQAIDLARGIAPDRPVRLEWYCDDRADEVPWELVQPSAFTLGWFGSPPVTVVRVISPDRRRASIPDSAAHSPLTRPTMAVIRGPQDELDSSDFTYQRTQRRTRRSNVRLRTARPTVIAGSKDLDGALREQADIFQIWAHCGPAEVRFTEDARFPTGEFADRLAECSPRLVVLAGCRSGSLGRALVRRGVAAVAAMREEIYGLAVQPLVQDLVSLVLAGEAVDLAFAAALRGYALTGQPGAVAVPMLYLAAGLSGRLFPADTPAISTAGRA